jgi:predicted CoA-binding protein
MPTPRYLDAIRRFLATKRIAIIGLSRNPHHFSTMLFNELLRRGYDVIPVNPHANNILGHPCFALVGDIQPPVEAALIMTPPSATDAAVADCVQAGVRRIWLYSAGSGGAVTDSAISLCNGRGIEVIPGECPYMFLPNNGLHAVHGFINKLIGRYPKSEAA